MSAAIKTTHETADGLPIYQYLNEDGSIHYGVRAADRIQFFHTSKYWGGSIKHEITQLREDFKAAMICTVVLDNSGEEITREVGLFFKEDYGGSFVQAGKTINSGRALAELGIGIEFPEEIAGEAAVGEELERLVKKSTGMIRMIKDQPAMAAKLVNEADGDEEVKKDILTIIEKYKGSNGAAALSSITSKIGKRK